MEITDMLARIDSLREEIQRKRKLSMVRIPLNAI